MNTHLLLAVTLAFLCPVTAAWALIPGPQSDAIPQIDSARLEMQWNDLRSLLQELHAARAREYERPKPVPPPPFDWAISEARYDARVDTGTSMEVRAEFHIEVLREGAWAKIPILKNTVAPVNAMLNGEPISLSADTDGWLVLGIQKPGVYRFETTFYTDVRAREGVLRAEFPCARTPVTHMTLFIPVKDAQVAAPDALNIAIEPSEDGLTATLAFRSTENIAVQWTLPAVLKAKEEEAAKPPEPPRVASMATTLATITDSYLACSTQLRFDVLHGVAHGFTIAVPKGVNVLEVTGQGAAWSVSAKDDEQLVEVKVNHAVEADYDVLIRYEMPIDEKAPVIAVPELRVADVVRQAGFIGLAARSNVEVAPAEGVEHLTRIDISELPDTLRAMTANPLLLGYRYVGGRYFLPVEVRRLQDVAVRVASIDRAALVTMITEEGMAVTRARYDVRNNMKQFLRITLPAGAEVWSAEVGGKVVKPARDGDNGAILIPLFKSVETGRVLDTFPVEVVYMESAQKAPLVFGSHTLKAPATDILANEIAWQVLVPEDQRVLRTTGDLKPAIAGAMVRHAALNRGRSSVSQETILQLREGIDRFYIQDINNPAASGHAAGAQPRFQGEALATVDTRDVEVAGVLPVRIDLPVEGVSYLFRRLMAPEGQDLSLTLHVYHARWDAYGRRAFAIGGWAVVAGVAWLALKLARGARVPRWQGLLAAIAFAGVLALRHIDGNSLWGFVLWTVLAAAGAALLPWAHSRVKGYADAEEAVSAEHHEA